MGGDDEDDDDDDDDEPVDAEGTTNRECHCMLVRPVKVGFLLLINHPQIWCEQLAIIPC